MRSEIDVTRFVNFMGFDDSLTDVMKRFVRDCYPIWADGWMVKMCCLTCAESGRLVSATDEFEPHLYCTIKREQVGFRCGCMRWIGRL